VNIFEYKIAETKNKDVRVKKSQTKSEITKREEFWDVVNFGSFSGF
jgi:hypothetical protein